MPHALAAWRPSPTTRACAWPRSAAPRVCSRRTSQVRWASAPTARRERRAQDAANNTLLLSRMAGVSDRRARFVSTLVALRHAEDPEPLIAFGRWEATLLRAPRGGGGFGYDPLVWIDALGASVAELDSVQKNAVSHRALAAAQMRALMRDAWSLE